jgi:hypothetical protein
MCRQRTDLDEMDKVAIVLAQQVFKVPCDEARVPIAIARREQVFERPLNAA